MRVCHLPYLHLDLHAAVGERLDDALNPYERLHLSGRNGVDKVSERLHMHVCTIYVKQIIILYYIVLLYNIILLYNQ